MIFIKGMSNERSNKRVAPPLIVRISPSMLFFLLRGSHLKCIMFSLSFFFPNFVTKIICALQLPRKKSGFEMYIFNIINKIFENKKGTNNLWLKVQTIYTFGFCWDKIRQLYFYWHVYVPIYFPSFFVFKPARLGSTRLISLDLWNYLYALGKK